MQIKHVLSLIFFSLIGFSSAQAKTQEVKGKFFLINKFQSEFTTNYVGVLDIAEEQTLPLLHIYYAGLGNMGPKFETVLNYGLLSRSVILTRDLSLDPKNNRYLVSISTTFISEEARSNLPELFFYAVKEGARPLEEDVYKINTVDNYLPMDTQLAGPEIIGYKLKRNQKTCGKDTSCFDLQVFALSPISAIDGLSCYYFPGARQNCNLAEENEKFINLKTGNDDEITNYSAPVFTRVPYLTETGLEGLDAADLIRDLFVKKSFSFKSDYLSFSENPKLADLTILAKPSFDAVYAQVFDEPFAFNKINGFQCQYEEHIPGSDCVGNFIKNYESEYINGSHVIKFCAKSPCGSDDKVILKISPSDLYKNTISSVKVLGDTLPVNEFKDEFINTSWHTTNPNSNHWCDISIRHTLSCTWKN